MMIVRCILVETTLPVRIRPRIDTPPVKGHFLSAQNVSVIFANLPIIAPEIDNQSHGGAKNGHLDCPHVKSMSYIA
jgi:hypothetical protein